MMWGFVPARIFRRSADGLVESRQNVGRLVFSAISWAPGRWLSDTWGVAVFGGKVQWE
jgi:hypothetical protein